MPNISEAIYASNNKGIDVTAIVQSIVSGGNDDVPVNNNTLTDPDPGSEKYFMVWYTSAPVNNGNPIGLACSENGTIDLVPYPWPMPAPDAYYYTTAPQPSLGASSITAITVDRAVYGTQNNGFDVTAICQAIFNEGALFNDVPGTYAVAVNNQTFGGDPDVGNTKSFAMQYQVNGSGPFYLGASEGQVLNIPNVT
jgi:hypothetical protein